MSPDDKRFHDDNSHWQADYPDGHAAKALHKMQARGPLVEDPREPDAFDFMMGSPHPWDFEPCGPHCESSCPCRLRPRDD